MQVFYLPKVTGQTGQSKQGRSNQTLQNAGLMKGYTVCTSSSSRLEILTGNRFAPEAYNSTNQAMIFEMSYRRKVPFHWLVDSRSDLYKPCC